MRAEIDRRQVHPADTVVLLPYAQLMQPARSAWALDGGAAQFMPRFETSMNWSRSLGGFLPAAHDLRHDAARDLLTAAALLARAGLARHQALAPRLMQAAWSIGPVAAAQVPKARLQWGQDTGVALEAGLEAPALALELALGRIALAWAASSSYPSDCLFVAEPGLLLLLQGFSTEPLHAALRKRLGERAAVLPLYQDAPVGSYSLRAAPDGEDEAQQAASCVLAHLAQGRAPVGLVAQDRVLTRRVRALLAERGVALRDETGWKLSTTRAAAGVMALLRAQVWDAGTDAVLDWLKHAGAFGADDLTRTELQLRKDGVRQWRAAPVELPLVRQLQPLRAALQGSRPLSLWLDALRSTLQLSGQWSDLLADSAGQALLDALRLHDGAQAEFADVAARLELAEFTTWVSQTLEAARYQPVPPEQAQVVILPLGQLLGRPLAAVVLPGCDERRLPVSPEPAEMWTAQQRAVLGLPSREQLAQDSRAVWRYALQSPWLDILWRSAEGGERLLPSGFVQELQLLGGSAPADERRVRRALAPRPVAPPLPVGAALPVTRLSASGYEDLRRCPYRFFALRQLRLQEVDELDAPLDQRDFGNWLHCALRHFHEALQAAPSVAPELRQRLIDAAAQRARTELGLSDSEYLPFAAAWPRLRDGYLQWLAQHEASGARFEAAEAWKELGLGAVTLVGKLDRIDRLGDGSALVLDYKTESRSTTTQRIKQGSEDTQLAFYAALIPDDSLHAAYLNVAEKDGTRALPAPAIVELRDRLIEGIAHDLQRIHAGAALPALGEGAACEYCAARGLCRRDFWPEGADRRIAR